MSTISRFFAPFTFALFAAGCAVAPEGDANVDANDDGVEAEDGTAALASTRFLLIRPDYRRCASPMCGGIFYKPANQSIKRCADGREAANGWCYASDADWSGVPSSARGDARTIVEARIVPSTLFKGYVKLVPTAAWRGAIDTIPVESTGKLFHRVVEERVRCVDPNPARCAPSQKVAIRLNASTRRPIAGVNFGATTGATAEQIAAAQAAIAKGNVIAFGGFGSVPVRGGGGVDTVLSATQFYLKIEADKPAGACKADAECATGTFCIAGACAASTACRTDADCTATSYPRRIASKSDCHCPTCPTAVNASFAKENAAAYGTFCTGAPIACPRIACQAPPPVACVANRCTFR
jgi:hypothetical protein